MAIKEDSEKTTPDHNPKEVVSKESKKPIVLEVGMKGMMASFYRFFIPPRLEKGKMLRVHEENIEFLLEKLGVLKSLQKGELVCDFCGNGLTKDNLECIYSKHGRLGFCCKKKECYFEFLELRNK